MHAAQLVREARRAVGLSQRDLADRVGIAQPALADIERGAHDTSSGQLDRLLRFTGYRVAILPTTASSAADWADLIYQELRSTRRSENVAFNALIGFSDELVAQSRPLQVALCVAPPATCGDRRFDAAIAAIVEHHLAATRLPIHDWVREPSRRLSEPWLVSPFTDPQTVPKAFRRHGVLLAASELASV